MLVQAEALKINKPLMVVGTPGRLTELSRMGRLQIHHCHTLILDEVIPIATYSLVIFHELAPACINLFCMHASTFSACMYEPFLHACIAFLCIFGVSTTVSALSQTWVRPAKLIRNGAVSGNLVNPTPQNN